MNITMWHGWHKLGGGTYPQGGLVTQTRLYMWRWAYMGATCHLRVPLSHFTTKFDSQKSSRIWGYWQSIQLFKDLVTVPFHHRSIPDFNSLQALVNFFLLSFHLSAHPEASNKCSSQRCSGTLASSDFTAFCSRIACMASIVAVESLRPSVKFYPNAKAVLSNLSERSSGLKGQSFQ